MRDPRNYGYFISAIFLKSLNCTVLLYVNLLKPTGYVMHQQV